jgi:hypothetical protein
LLNNFIGNNCPISAGFKPNCFEWIQKHTLIRQ